MPRTIASFHFTACSPWPSTAAIIGVLGVEGTIEIDADDLVPEIPVGLQERHRPVPAGVVDENPDRSDFGLDLRDRTIDRRTITDVNSVDRDRGLRRELRRLKSGVGIDIENRDLAAFFREPKGDRAPDALAATGNDRHLA